MFEEYFVVDNQGFPIEDFIFQNRSDLSLLKLCVCRKCGCVVASLKQHVEWHETLSN